MQVANEIERQALQWGKGARGIITFKWDDGSAQGHAINFEVDSDYKVQFVDSQQRTNHELVRLKMSTVIPSSVRYGRTDDLPLSGKALDLSLRKRSE